MADPHFVERGIIVAADDGDEVDVGFGFVPAPGLEPAHRSTREQVPGVEDVVVLLAEGQPFGDPGLALRVANQ
jgi:hypothetical protein